MPTRAATAAAAAANMRTTRSRKVATQPSGKENDNASLPSPPMKAQEKAAPKKPARNVKAKKVEEQFCSCRGVDDGTPMVQCGTCDEWYHFRCIQLSEDDASEILVYVCPSCQEKTGRRTVSKYQKTTLEWEGFEALEPIENVTAEEPSGTVKTQTTPEEEPIQAGEAEEPRAESQQQRQRLSPAELSESSDDGSGDEYVEEGLRREDAAEGGHKRKRANNRRITASSSDSEGSEKEKAATTSAHPRRKSVTSTKLKIASTSPPPGRLKRKQSINATGAAAAPTVAKRKRAESTSTTTSATDDPARKYCLGKFTEMFTGIYTQHPYIQQEGKAEEEESKKVMAERKPEGLAEEEKTQVRERATVFAAELEQAVFDTYAESDKHGKLGAGVKYKERFRTLTFNLQQSDRVALHKRIASGQVAAAKLATMSSTELASQEQQESIKLAEQEALEHSILVKATVPRAKITHKGLQDIEDVNEDSLVAKQREREQEMAEQERERERLARLRTVQPQSHMHSNPPSASAPPESPVVPSSASGAAPASWGAPPPVPITQAPDLAPAMDTELNLGDFIHMDDEPSESASAPIASPVEPNLPASSGESSGIGQGQGQQGVSTAITGISPFAPSKPDMPPRASFDLNALWSAPPPPPPPAPPNEDGDAPREGTDVNDGGDAMDLGTPPPPADEVSSRGGEPAYEGGPERGGAEHEGEGGDDLDFAMFLGQEEEEKDKEKDKEKETAGLASRPDPQVVFEGLPHVWNGIISMPVDSSVSQELRVVARQIGGRGLVSDSPLWRTLFPLDHLRIDGRVAVGNSAQYLLASRLNSAKELIAVAWTPVSDADMAALKTLSTFLINKDRHGLIFPWGSRGRDWGRELYVIPLLSSHTLPEYIELLDDLHLPATRSEDCLVGIWVLNRGKLAALAPPAPLPVPPQPATSVLPHSQPTHAGQPSPFAPLQGQHSSGLPPALASALASIMPAGTDFPNAAPAALAAALSYLPTAPATVTPTAPASVLPPFPPASAAELAAQVASLSPDQIQTMLLALQQQQQLPQDPLSSGPPPPPVPSIPPPPMQAPLSLGPVPIHVPVQPLPWGVQQQHQSPTHTMPTQKPYSGYDERERGGARRGGYYGRDESSRGRGRGGVRRGVGVGTGAGAGAGGREDGRGDYRRMSDTGWGGRGGRGSGSPGRRDSAPYWR